MAFVPKEAIRAVNVEKGRKGGIATAQKHSKEWLQQRGYRGGTNTRDLYGADYYRHINSQRKVRRGWPKGKLRKVVKAVQQLIESKELSDGHTLVLRKAFDSFR